MAARRVSIKQKAAALEAAEAQRRFQAETLGEAAQPAESPNQDRFVQQLTGRVSMLSDAYARQRTKLSNRAIRQCANPKVGQHTHRQKEDSPNITS